MAITDKEKGVWGLDQVYNKINQGSIWEYSAPNALWVWGSDGGRQLGLNDNAARSSPTQLTGTTWATTNLGTQPLYARFWMRTDGTLWMWGNNQSGLLGQSQNEYDSGNQYSSPIQIPGTTWKQCAGSVKSMYGVKTDGTLWAWGSNSYGALGINQPRGPTNHNSRSSPTQIPGTSWDSVGSCGFGGAAIRTDGTLWVWGLNQQGELAQNSVAPDTWTGISSPKQIPGTTWSYVVGDYNSIGALKTDGTMWTWGRNDAGQLGQNNVTQYSSPVQIPGSDWGFIQVGYCAIGSKTDGTLWTWGANEAGGLGHNNNVKYSSPTQVGSGTDWKSTSWSASTRNGEYAVRNNTSAAIKTDGTLWAWGQNESGQLGVNDRTTRSSPVQVIGSEYLNVQVYYDHNNIAAMSLQ